MDVNDLKGLYAEVNKRMHTALEHLQHEFAGVRTGRASVTILNSVHQVRRDANERLKKLLKDHEISEDDEKKGLDEVQKITDNHIRNIDDLQKKKDAELLGK